MAQNRTICVGTLGQGAWRSAHPSDPDFVMASTVNGQVFCSSDAGDSWTKYRREFGEAHALAWVANP